MPKISIIVPAYNEEKHIARCLDSILNQTFSDFEVLCIDDGSTDSTFDIIKKYSEADSRIIPFKNTGKGVSSARNLGLDNAKGEYIGFVDSDDFIQPQTYEFLLRAIIENNADMSVCNFIRTSKINTQFFDYTSEICTGEKLLKNNNFNSIYCVWTKLIKKYIITEYFENFITGEDTLFTSYLWLNSKLTIFIDLPLYNYYLNTNSVTLKDYSKEKWKSIIKAYLLSYRVFKNSNKEKEVSLDLLDSSLKFLLSYRMYYKDYSKEIKELFKECFYEYKKCSDISLANKIYVYISYHFPLLYELRRKLLDKTLR